MDSLDKDFEAILVLGAGYAHLDELEAFVAQRTRFSIQRTPPKMSELMLWADLAVTAGGSTCYEVACLGLPNIAAIAADNQVPLVGKLDELGVLVSIGWHDAIEIRLASELDKLLGDSGRRFEMSRRGRDLIDGQGAPRVAKEIGQLCACQKPEQT